MIEGYLELIRDILKLRKWQMVSHIALKVLCKEDAALGQRMHVRISGMVHTLNY